MGEVFREAPAGVFRATGFRDGAFAEALRDAVRFFAVFVVFPVVLREAAVFRLPGRGGLAACFRRALPFGVFALAVLRRPPALRAVARAPAPAFRFEGVLFCPRDLPVVFALFFLAIETPSECCFAVPRHRAPCLTPGP